jgi:hypothetical protein
LFFNNPHGRGFLFFVVVGGWGGVGVGWVGRMERGFRLFSRSLLPL